MSPADPTAPRATNLLPATDALVGRARELAALAAQLADGARLVTITGAAGVGKTRLAQELGRAVLAAHDGEVWFADLTEARGRDDVCRAVGDALDVPIADGDATRPIGRALAGRGRVLLVLDNFEQLVEHAPQTVGAWLAAAPQARIVVTSREALRLSAEVPVELGPLAVDPGDGGLAPPAGRVAPAVQLLLERARRQRPEWHPSPDEFDALAAIARRLDGMPLAIELAAARMSVMGPAQVLAGLEEPLALLTRGARDGAARHRTLRAALDWSWRLLEPREQVALAQCAVFRGGFDLDAAVRVLALDTGAEPAEPAAMLDAIQMLRDKCLLVAHAPPDAPAALRLGMYLSVREYAAERLAARGAAEVLALEARHTAHYVARAEAWAAALDAEDDEEDSPRTAAAAVARAALVLERDNLVAVVERALARASAAPAHDALPAAEHVATALRAVLAIDAVASFRGPYPAQLALLDRTLAAPGAARVAPELRGRALVARANYARPLGRLADALADARAALDAATRAPGSPLAGDALRAVALARYYEGAYDEALATLARGVEAHRHAGLLARAGVVLADLGALLRERGRLDEAEEPLGEALELLERGGGLRQRAAALLNLGALWLERASAEDARACLTRAHALAERAGDRRLAGLVGMTLAVWHHDSGELAAADECFARAAETCRLLGTRRTEGHVLGYWGALAHEQGRLDEARARLERARAILGEVGERRYAAYFTAHLAAVEASAGRHETARRLTATLDEAASEGDGAAPGDDPLRAASALLRAGVELAAAHGADPARASSLRAAAHARLSAVDAREAAPVDARLARRLLARMPGAVAADASAPASPEPPRGAGSETAARGPAAASASVALRVHREGLWFALGSAPAVDCRKRQAVRLLLAALVRQRLATPGRALTTAEMIAAGWPGERIRPDAALNRLYVTLNRLRNLGLRAVLRTDAGGCLLDPAHAVHLDAGDEPPADPH